MLCVVRTSFTKSSRKHESKKIEGDALIERILKSDRFSELADMIVVKALEKLKQETVSTSFDAIKNNTQIDETNHEKTNIKPSKKGHKTKSKIDVGAVLQNKILPLNDLIFRYERFTKNPDAPPKKSHTKTSDGDKKKHSKTKERADQKSSKKGTKHKPKPASNEQSKSDKDDNSNSQEKSEKDKHTDLSSENMTFNKIGQNVSSENRFGDEKLIYWGNNEKVEEAIDLDKSIEEKPRPKKKSKLKRTTESIARANTNHDLASNEDNKHKNDENQTLKESSSMKPDHKLKKNEHETGAHQPVGEKDEPETSIALRADDRDLESDDEDNRSIKLALEQADTNSDEESDATNTTEKVEEKKKRIVRKEGNRLFALEESPDYAEYHEKLSQIRKSEIKL